MRQPSGKGTSSRRGSALCLEVTSYGSRSRRYQPPWHQKQNPRIPQHWHPLATCPKCCLGNASWDSNENKSISRYYTMVMFPVVTNYTVGPSCISRGLSEASPSQLLAYVPPPMHCTGSFCTQLRFGNSTPGSSCLKFKCSDAQHNYSHTHWMWANVTGPGPKLGVELRHFFCIF